MLEARTFSGDVLFTGTVNEMEHFELYGGYDLGVDYYIVEAKGDQE